jgi:hypothetical protein
MVVSSIIANAISKADLGTVSWYSQNDQLFDAQVAWNTIYELLAENDDDYFLTSLYLTPSVSFTSDTNRQYVYIYPLPTDFFRLRMFSYQGNVAQQFYPCTKADNLNFGYTQNTPSYRMIGTNLELYDPYGFTKYNLWYYPSPVQLIMNTDLSYPKNALIEYMSWQIAADIRRKQNQDPTIQQERANELMAIMKRQSHRDDFRVQTPKDIFSDGNNYWV